MEHLQEQKDAISEYQKLKQRLILTAEERKNWSILQKKLYRKCNCCGQIKPASEFYGRYAYCKVCKNNKSKVLYYKKRIALYQSKIKECQDKIINLGEQKMNSEEQIEKFRREMLPKYTEMAEKLKHNKCITKIFEVHYIDKSELKQCSKCGQWLPKDEFYKDRTYCKTCEKVRAARHIKENPQ